MMRPKPVMTDAEIIGCEYGSGTKREAERLCFDGAGDLDTYNPSVPFLHAGQRHIAVRLEERNGHVSQTRFFREYAGKWVPASDTAVLPLEDPFVFLLHGITCLGGVEFMPDAASGKGSWRTLVFDISDLNAPAPVFSGPPGMKDLRMCDYADGRIGVFTRPQGQEAGKGTVGYCEVSSLEELRRTDLVGARLVGHPAQNSWEGVNQAIPIDDDRVLLIGHIAWMEKPETRHYYAAKSMYHRRQGTMDPWSIILKREELPPGPAKRQDLVDVLFPGGVERTRDGITFLYLGVSDAECWRCPVILP